jgi:hypothetical protein
MTAEPDVCPFCKVVPDIATYIRDSVTMRPGNKPTYAVRCVAKCSGRRVVETHRFASREEAVKAWNERE